MFDAEAELRERAFASAVNKANKANKGGLFALPEVLFVVRALEVLFATYLVRASPRLRKSVVSREKGIVANGVGGVSGRSANVMGVS
jgi:hypothetical protein